MESEPEDIPWHALDAAEMGRRLNVDPAEGLSEAEASRRLASFGRNELEVSAGPSRLATLAGQFNSVLVWILIAAAFTSGVLLHELIDTWVIVAIVIMNAVLGYVQETRAEAALAALKQLAAPHALVVREGVEREILSAELVPGDVVVLVPGDRVPADCRLVEAVHLEAVEGLLTGESFPVGKIVHPVEADASLRDRCSMVFAGTAISAGRGRALVAATGDESAMGRIAGMLGVEEPATPLEAELARVGKKLGAIALGTAAVVFVVGMTRGNSAEAMLLTAVALAVAAIPEGLPAVVTITLSSGVSRMAEENAIVRRLPAVEALGAATVVCTDKTGTLTRNEIRVQSLLVARAELTPKAVDRADPRVARYLEVAALCNDSRRGPDGYVGDPTEVALLASVVDAGADPEQLREAMPRVDELAFDSARKLMTTLHREEGRYRAAVKGAPEIVVLRCARIEEAGGAKPLDSARRSSILDEAERLAAAGLRTLALAYRTLEGTSGAIEDVEEDLTLVGVVGMSDELRPEAFSSVREAQLAGIRVVMVTGDHEVTARSIAGELGILRPSDEVMPGEVLRRLDVAQLAEEVHRYSVYARVDPADKVKIVQAWQRRGEIVAMTGDGVNDAPALRAADIGVAMGTGTDVAKEAAAMVLADDNFATIVSAVRQGRGIFANLRKVVHFLLGANASEVLVMFFGFLAFGWLGQPLVAVQLLWINLITDGLPALTLGLDPPEPGIMDGSRSATRSILSARQQLRLLNRGSILGMATLGMLVVGHYVLDYSWPEVQTSLFTTLVVVQLVYAFNVRSEHTPVWKRALGDNPWLMWATLGSLALQVGVVYAPVGHTLFGTASVPVAAWGWIVAFTAASFVTVAVVSARGVARRVGGDR